MASYQAESMRRPEPVTGLRRSDSWRPDDERHGHQFSFRNSAAAPQYPREHDHYDVSRQRPRARYADEYGRGHRGLEGTFRNRNETYSRARLGPRSHAGSQRGRGNRLFATAARPLLRLKEGDTIEQNLGISDDPNTAKRFLHIDDMTDSEEEQMVESDSDLDTSNVPVENFTEPAIAQSSLEPTPKRRALGVINNGRKEASQVPKWSNPDPYTALPPVDELRKRKDVVKLIRKARIAIDKDARAVDQAGINEDFISFGFEEAIAIREDTPHSSSETTEDHDEGGVSFALAAPKRFSHLQNLHGENAAQVPGAEDMAFSTNAKGGLGSEQNTETVNLDNRNSDNDNPLGGRKRTYDDIIKDPPDRFMRSKKPFLEKSGGFVLEAWRSGASASSTPWLDKSAWRCENTGFRLHKEICDFYDYVRPQTYEQEIREELLDRMQTVITNQFHHCRVYCFGSFAAGIYLPNADMDLVVISESFRISGTRVACQSSSSMQVFGEYLRRSGVAEADSVEVITQAKVPLIKFIDQITGIRVDMSFENQTGLTANETFDTWKSQFPAMPIIVTLIKQFLLMRGLSEVVNGGLGGFSVTCLVTSLLQNLPRVQCGDFIPEQHLGEILLEFLDLYGNRLDTTRTGITMNPPGYFTKYPPNEWSRRYREGRQIYRANKADRLAVMDPNNPNNDISGGSRNVALILDRFSQAHAEIIKVMKSQARLSLLEWMVGGNYAIFTNQRRHLRKLYKQMRGTLERTAIEIRVQLSALPNDEQRATESLKRTQEDAQMRLTPDQRRAELFVNPLSEDAKIVAQRLPQKFKKGKKQKPKKVKVKKPKKEAVVPVMDIKPDPDVKPASVSFKKPKAENIQKIKAEPTETIEATSVKCELPNIPNTDVFKFATKEELVEMARASLKRKPKEKIEVAEKVKGKAKGKAKKKRRRFAEKEIEK